MRRLGAILVMVMLLALTGAGPARAYGGPQALSITSVTVIATGGTWPYCEVTGRVAYTIHGHTPGFVGVFPYRKMASFEGAMAITRGSGTVDMVMPTATDYSQAGVGQPEGWYWVASSGTGPIHHNLWAVDWMTSTYDFHGACPAPGTVIAGGMTPWVEP